MINADFYMAKARQNEFLREAETHRLQKQAGTPQKTKQSSLAFFSTVRRTIKHVSENIVNPKKVSFE